MYPYIQYKKYIFSNLFTSGLSRRLRSYSIFVSSRYPTDYRDNHQYLLRVPEQVSR